MYLFAVTLGSLFLLRGSLEQGFINEEFLKITEKIDQAVIKHSVGDIIADRKDSQSQEIFRVFLNDTKDPSVTKIKIWNHDYINVFSSDSSFEEVIEKTNPFLERIFFRESHFICHFLKISNHTSLMNTINS